MQQIVFEYITNRIRCFLLQKASVFIRQISISIEWSKVQIFNNGYQLSHNRQFENLKTLSSEPVEKAEFTSRTTRGAYIAAVYQSDLTFFFSSADQVAQHSKADIVRLDRSVSYAFATKFQVLKFTALDEDTVFTTVLINVNFTNNSDSSPHLDVSTTLMDKQQNCDIIHYTNSKSLKVSRGALAAKLCFLVNRFDTSSITRLAINDILNCQVPLKLFKDLKSFFDKFFGLSSTTKKHLLIDFCVFCQAY